MSVPAYTRNVLAAMLVICGSSTLLSQDAAALAMRARVNLYDTWNFDSVAYYLDLVIGTKDAPPFAYTDYGWYLWLKDERAKGMSMIGKAAKMDPADGQLSTWYAWALLWDDKLAEARLWIDKALKISPEYGEALYVASLISSQEGDHARALDYARQAATADRAWRSGIPLAMAYAGNRHDAITAAAKYESDLSAFDALLLTEVYTILDDRDKALDFLERAYDMRHPFLPWLQYWPGIQALQEEPRFEEIVIKMNLPD